MPNVTIFIPTEKMPPEAALAELTVECTQLCTEILKAALDNVHIIYVAVVLGRGHPAFAEIKYRLEPFRTQPVMDDFMEKLDDVIQRHTALIPRIRCFGYAAHTINARN